MIGWDVCAGVFCWSLEGDDMSVIKRVRVRRVSCACWSGPWWLCRRTLIGSPHRPKQEDNA
eukprot:8659171-Ditylum_brightwellii.AAC.1